MKKALMTAGILALLVCNSHALDNLHFDMGGNEYAAGIQAHTGLSGLRMFERVYTDPSGSGLLSEIDWDIGFQAVAGTGFQIAPSDPFRKTGFALTGMLWWHFPVNHRVMRDTDWDDAGGIFAYGENSASTLSGMMAEGSIAVYFPLGNAFVIEAFAGLWYGRYAAIAHDGWTSWYGDTEKTQVYGTAVEYIQEWITLAPGIGFKGKVKNTHIGIRAALSPLVWGYHIDNHYFRKLDSNDPDQYYMSYTDDTKGGVFFMIQTDCRWNITRYAQIGIGVHYRAIENSRGDTVINTAGLSDYSLLEKETAGAAIRIISFDLTIRTLL